MGVDVLVSEVFGDDLYCTAKIIAAMIRRTIIPIKILIDFFDIEIVYAW